MHTFADWLRYYNDLNVAPGLEAFEKMKASADKGINILKDEVCLPGMSLHCVLRGTIDQGTELYSPCKEAYAMLREAVVGGQSLVFTQYHKAGITKLRPHRFKQLRVC